MPEKRGLMTSFRRGFDREKSRMEVVSTEEELGGERGAGERCEYVETVFFGDLELTDLQQAQGVLNAFLLIAGNGKKTWMLSCISDDEKRSWMEDILHNINLQNVQKELRG